jgi:hypothetical protein
MDSPERIGRLNLFDQKSVGDYNKQKGTCRIISMLVTADCGLSSVCDERG